MGLFKIFKKRNKDIDIFKGLKKNISKISFGKLGKFSIEKINIDDIFNELKYKNIEKEKQYTIASKILNDWKNLIETHNQYIINYFMSIPFITNGFDENWDELCFLEKQKNLGEKELENLRKEYEENLQNEIEMYLNKQSTKDIRELYEKYFPLFDYDKFLNSIELEYLNFGINNFSIQLSDKENILFCAAYESFDKNLQGLDWHNF